MPLLRKEEMATLRCLLLLSLLICVTHSQTLIGPSSGGVEQGEEATLSCSVNGGTGSYPFRWLDTSVDPTLTIFDGTSKTGKEQYGNFEVSNQDTSSTMTISQIAIDDEGTYQCTAGVLDPVAGAEIDVEVKGSLTTTFPSIVVAEQSYDVECMVTGSRPQVSINWYIDGAQQGGGVPTTAQTPSNSNLSDTTIAFTFTPSKVVHPGTVELKCKVTGYQAATILAPEEVQSYSVQYPPESVTVMFSLVVNGTNVSCEFEDSQDGNPPSSHFFIYHNGTLINDPTSGVNFKVIDTPEKGSMFQCVAGNQHGNVTASKAYPTPTSTSAPTTKPGSTEETGSTPSIPPTDGTSIPTKPSNCTSPSCSEGKRNIVPAVVGGVIGGVLLIILIVVLVMLFKKGYFDECCGAGILVETQASSGNKTAPTAAPRKVVDHTNDNPEGVEYAMVTKQPGAGPKGDQTDSGKNGRGQTNSESSKPNPAPKPKPASKTEVDECIEMTQEKGKKKKNKKSDPKPATETNVDERIEMTQEKEKEKKNKKSDPKPATETNVDERIEMTQEKEKKKKSKKSKSKPATETKEDERIEMTQEKEKEVKSKHGRRKYSPKVSAETPE